MGELNAITDVKGVTIGHKTLIQSENIRTGVTAIIPHQKTFINIKFPQQFTLEMVLGS